MKKMTALFALCISALTLIGCGMPEDTYNDKPLGQVSQAISNSTSIYHSHPFTKAAYDWQKCVKIFGKKICTPRFDLTGRTVIQGTVGNAEVRADTNWTVPFTRTGNLRNMDNWRCGPSRTSRHPNMLIHWP